MASSAFAHPFRALSLSVRRAPLAVREQLALDEAACRQLLRTLRHELGLTDLLVLSTCQRTEVYYTGAQERSREILLALSHLKQRPVGPDWQPYFEVLTEAEAAVQHLFEVALGLEARVLGDWQVIGQVKQAYQWSAALGMAGPFLHRLLHAVFAAHKRVQTETRFRNGAASASYATLKLVQKLTAHLARPRVLVVGVGAIGADVCCHLVARKTLFGDVALCNRTRQAAVPQVRDLIAESLAELRTWSHAWRISPLIKQLKNKLEHLRQPKLDRYGKRLSPAEAALLEATTRSLMQQMLKQQVLHLKAACQYPNNEPLAAQLSEFFAFDQQAVA